jgi:hypothetical protein
MPTTLNIQGIPCQIPDPPKVIDGQKYKTKDQYFRRTKIPAFMASVGLDEDWNLCNIINENGQNRKLPLTEEQETFINREIDRCKDGYWFMKKGVPTWIPGRYYDWLNYWTLEDGTGYSSPDRKIEYRAPDRNFYIFFGECYDDPVIKGIARGKKVREGATSQGAQISTHEASFLRRQGVRNGFRYRAKRQIRVYKDDLPRVFR